MASNFKENWKETGKTFGTAFSTFGKTVAKSAKTIVKKTSDKVTKEDKHKDAVEVDKDGKIIKEQTVFNDGTWRKTGSGIGVAFASLGKSIGNTFTGKRNSPRNPEESKKESIPELECKDEK